MAYIQQSKFERSRRYINKKLRVTLRGLHPSKIQGRFSGPVIISNSIPKSGTHLIEGVLERLPLIRNAGIRTISEGGNNTCDVIERKLNKLKKGAFYNAHIPARQGYIDSLKMNNVKVLLLVRDPRDIAVSRYKYVTEIDMLHPAHSHFKNAENDIERLRMAITGVPGAMPPLAEVFRDFSGWLQFENVLLCKFEDLRGQAGGGGEDLQKETINNVIKHLGFSSDEIDIDLLIHKAFSQKSSTFRKGKIGGWRDEFDETLLTFITHELAESAGTFGYELSDV